MLFWCGMVKDIIKIIIISCNNVKYGVRYKRVFVVKKRTKPKSYISPLICRINAENCRSKAFIALLRQFFCCFCVDKEIFVSSIKVSFHWLCYIAKYP